MPIILTMGGRPHVMPFDVMLSEAMPSECDAVRMRCRHPDEGQDPVVNGEGWVPAFAGMAALLLAPPPSPG
jgi:hypothetical protein